MDAMGRITTKLMMLGKVGLSLNCFISEGNNLMLLEGLMENKQRELRSALILLYKPPTQGQTWSPNLRPWQALYDIP